MRVASVNNLGTVIGNNLTRVRDAQAVILIYHSIRLSKENTANVKNVTALGLQNDERSKQ